MTFFKKVSLSIGLACTALAATTLFASAYTTDYSVTYVKEQILYSPYYQQGPARFSCNTRPASGTGGIRIAICNWNGNEYAAKIFPYYTNVSSLTYYFSNNAVAYVFGQAVDKNQTVTGYLGYNWTSLN